eukprot:TRINITY_DN4394_c0_g1_i1.p1 TRINITY_DN4394_c0_g1~~TRINITY_DN4394_c0_g1_i1.p1  ORF type:complete len:456 (-),score=71.64 TRINITY_DN4394_c0_g1_i1:219-1586(-)
MSGEQRFCLRWDQYQAHLVTAFESLLGDSDFVDVTLGVEGKKLHAHKMLLSACSPYFKDLLKGNPCQHPIILLRDLPYQDVEALLQFMYNGQVSVEQDQLDSFLKSATALKIQGLTHNSEDHKESESQESKQTKEATEPQVPGNKKRKRDSPPLANADNSVQSQHVPKAKVQAVRRGEGGRKNVKAEVIDLMDEEILDDPPKIVESVPHPHTSSTYTTQPVSQPHTSSTYTTQPSDHQQQYLQGVGVEEESEDIYPITDDYGDDSSYQDQQHDTGTSRIEYEKDDNRGNVRHPKQTSTRSEHGRHYHSSQSREQSESKGGGYLPKLLVEHPAKDAHTKPSEYASDNFQAPSARQRVEKESKTVSTAAEENEEVKQNVAASDLEALEANSDVPVSFHCNICEKKFANHDSFVAHKKFHSGLTVCSICTHPFSTIGTLNRHLRMVHKIPMGRPRSKL